VIIEGVSNLLGDIEFSFGLPALGFVMAQKFCRSTKYGSLMLRLSISYCLLLFIIMFATLMFQDRAVLTAMWHTSQILYSVVYALSCFLIVGAFALIISTKLRPSLWSVRNPETNV
jgi:hypothetical protein